MTPSLSAILSPRRLLVLGAILAVVATVYAGVSKAYFCGDDDFLEAHRTAFEDARTPSRMFTTPHFSSFKYRPFNRVLDLLTFRAGHGSPRAFHIRNLVFHLGNITLVYVLSALLWQPAAVSLGGALLFGLQPLANQTVSEAIWTNTSAHFLLLLTLVLFIVAVRSGRPLPLMLAAGFVAMTAVLFYDVEIVSFGCMYAYLTAEQVMGRRPGKRLWIYVTGLMLSCLALYSGMRLVFVRSGFGKAASSIPSFGVMLKNVVTYIGAVLLPVDPVLAHSWFGTPLPSEPAFNTGTYRLVVMGLGALTAAAALACILILVRARRPAAKWLVDLFFVVCGLLLLGPVLAFNARPSETYLYLPIAFLSLVAASILFDVCALTGSSARALYPAAVLVLAAWFGAATLIRNRGVESCGDIARKILTSIPPSSLTPGSSLVFVDAPGGVPSEHYGFYGFRGLDTIGNRPGERSRSVQCSLRVFSGQPNLSAIVLNAPQNLAPVLAHGEGKRFFSVQSDGTVTELHPTAESTDLGR